MGSTPPARQNRKRVRTPEPQLVPPKPPLGVRVRGALGRGLRGLGGLRFARPVVWIGRLIVLAAVTTGAVAGGRLLERHVRSAAAFATTVIDVSGNTRLSREEVLSIAGLGLGK